MDRQLLSGLTSFGIGGMAEVRQLIRPEDALQVRLSDAVILGGGSNVLISDGGIALPVYINRIAGIELFGLRLYAGGGERLGRVARYAGSVGLSGLEWAVGIPGTVGGAVCMNAGCFGGCMADRLIYVDAVAHGRTMRLYREECGFSYRHSRFLTGDILVTGACFRLESAIPADAMALERAYAQRRRQSQPGGRSAGSVYKAAELPAGYYIDRAGLKGHRVGGAEVSNKHANFIINTGGATARDVARLMEHIEARVYDMFGVRLEREIRLIGDF